MTGFDNPIAPKRGGYSAFISRIREWTCEALALNEATLISVNELACPEPGCPPRETVILAMPDGAAPIRARIHKTMAEVTADDVRAALAEDVSNSAPPRNAARHRLPPADIPRGQRARRE